MSRILRNPPSKCDSCGSSGVSFEEDRKLDSKRYWPWIYRCLDCGASVGCHPNTCNPTGYMANGYVRSLRAELHKIVDKFWRGQSAISRNAIYYYFSGALNIPNFHIGDLTLSELKRAIVLAETLTAEVLMPTNPTITHKPAVKTAGRRRRMEKQFKRRKSTQYDDFD